MGCFSLAALVDDAAMNIYKHLVTPLLSLLLGMCPEVKLLDHTEIPCLIFFFEKLLNIFKITAVTKYIQLLRNTSTLVSRSHLKVIMSKTKLPMPPVAPPPVVPPPQVESPPGQG